MSCTCPVNKLIRIQSDTEGHCISSFKNIYRERLCSSCLATTEDFPVAMKAAGMAPTDHWHPQLMLGVGMYIKKILEDAIFCKQNDYASLSLDNIQREVTKIRDSLADYEMGNITHDDDIENKERMLSALEFELKARALKKASESVIQPASG